jgi:hypothetical protein
VKKRYIRYLGRFSIDWRATLASEVQGVDWDAIEREECERLDAGEKARAEKLAALPAGLHAGPTDPTPVEPAQAPETSSLDALEEPDTPSDAPGSDDASGSSSLE